MFFSCEGGLHKAYARRAPCVRFARVKRLQSRRQFCACTPVVRFGNFIGEPYEIGATEHIARISIKWCYRAHCIASLCEALAVLAISIKIILQSTLLAYLLNGATVHIV
jgi:hypothetical protein